jgi:hypothetical protein
VRLVVSASPDALQAARLPASRIAAATGRRRLAKFKGMDLTFPMALD